MELMTLQNWLDSGAVDEAAKAELRALTDKSEIEDRFYRNLAFGTGGLRGKMAAGNNRMNRYTVAHATCGLARYLLENRSDGEAPSVCIGYDTRNLSRAFAHTAAAVLCRSGVQVYLFQEVHPTPMLSWAVRYHHADAGIVVTASHNPKEYNGYKVYGGDGGQITDNAAAAISDHIAACDLLNSCAGLSDESLEQSPLLHWMGEETDAPYFAHVRALSMRMDLLKEHAGELKILYSPLHGSGNKPVRRILSELGFVQTSVVPQQELPDGDFPTAPYPNPEIPTVFTLAKEMAQTLHPDLIFATDPDCDRIGVLSQDEEGRYVVLTGNQMGALLCEYILSTKKELHTLPENAAVVKTIVTTELARRICQEYGAALYDVLTGFKYIGELSGQWEESGAHTFLLGFEESYGYLAGGFVRDKDAVIAAALIAEMALYHKRAGRTLWQALQALYAKYGFYQEKLITIELPGRAGQEKIAATLGKLRADFRTLLAEKAPTRVEDYETGLTVDCATGESGKTGLPRSNVLKFFFQDGSWLVVRPSGTEPKMKLYLSVTVESAADAQTKMDRFEAFARQLLEA